MRPNTLPLALGIVLASAGSAWATKSFDTAHPVTNVIDGDVHWWNQGSMDREKVLTYNGYQYSIYWDAPDAAGDVHLAIHRRKLGTTTQETRILPSVLSVPTDPHNTCTLGISPNDGRLHVSWVVHNQPQNYAMSNAGCLSATNFSQCSFPDPFGRMSGNGIENRVTYPAFVNDPSTGKLFYIFRSGSGSKGSLYLYEYNDGGVWNMTGGTGKVVDGNSGTYDDDGPGPLAPSTSRGPYIDALRIDRLGRMHLTWTFREAISVSATDGYDYGILQHDIDYIYSEDYGVTWKNNAGTTVADLTVNDAVTIADATPGAPNNVVAVRIPAGMGRSNIARMELDSNNQPHIVMHVWDAPVIKTQLQDAMRDTNLRQKHFWRTSDTVWHESWVEPATTKSQCGVMGSLMFDRADNAYYVYMVSQLGWVPWNDDLNFTLLQYFTYLPTSNVVWRPDLPVGGNSLEIKPFSDVTAVDTRDRVGIPIGTGSSANRQVRISMRNATSATTMRISWTTDTSVDWSVLKQQAFPVTANDTSFHTYTFTITDPDWNGTLRLMELDLSSSTRTDADRINIDYIRVTNSSGTIAKAWEFSDGAKMLAAEASAATNWATWEVYDLLPGVSVTSDDTSFGIDTRRYDRDKVVSFPVVVQDTGGVGRELLEVFDVDLLGDDYVKAFEFAADTVKWQARKHVSGLAWASDGGVGALKGTITGNDSQIISDDGLFVPIKTASTVKIWMKTTAGNKARICWSTDGPLTFNDCAQFTVTADGAYHAYTLSTSGWTNWTNRSLRRLRIEPSDVSNVTSGSFAIDAIRILE
jgi:hypothetical protein